MATLMEQVGGMFTTLKTMFSKPVTVQYPFKMREMEPRFRGAVGFLPHPKTGDEKCVGCGLCAQACPIKCITMGVIEDDSNGDATDHSDEWHPFEHFYLPFANPEMAEANGKKFRFFYDINETRCMFCGLCVEACPVEALTMSHVFEMSTDNRANTVYGKDKLLQLGSMYMEETRNIGPSGKPQHIPLTTIGKPKKLRSGGKDDKGKSGPLDLGPAGKPRIIEEPQAAETGGEEFMFDENGNRVRRPRPRPGERW